MTLAEKLAVERLIHEETAVSGFLNDIMFRSFQRTFIFAIKGKNNAVELQIAASKEKLADSF